MGGAPVRADGATGVNGAIGAGDVTEFRVARVSGALTDSTKLAAADPFAAMTAPTDVVSITSSGSDLAGSGAGAAASPGLIETETFSPSRRRATLNMPTPAQS